jgi:hypothetical protein
MARLQRDLPTYIAAANGFSIDPSDVGDFTKGILSWLKSHAYEVGAWSEAARIAFAMTPNAAGVERVFSLLKILLRSNQDTALSAKFAGRLCFVTTTPSVLMKPANKAILGW